MTIGQIIVRYAWILAIAGLAFFVHKSTPRQRTAVGLAWLFPGLGHLWLGQRNRALVFGGIILLLYVSGMIMADFRNVSPFDRHPIWGLAQAPTAVPTLLAWLVTGPLLDLKIWTVNPYYAIGCLYTGTAGLLNILAMCDVWDLAGEKRPAPVREGTEA